MTEKSDRFLSLDQFKEKVYSNIGLLDAMDENRAGEILGSDSRGCLGIFLFPIFRYSNGKMREQFKIRDLNRQADRILADEEIKKILCEKLDATIVLPIDAAYKITPVLYAVALDDEEKVPIDAMLFAIISRKIVREGVENYCRSVQAEPETPAEPKKTGRRRSKS